MMKKILILSIFALAAGLVSCRKVAETAVPEEGVATGGRLCVTGSISDDASAGDSDATKTAFTCSSSHILTPVWKEGDEIIGLWGENKSVTWSVKELSEGKAVFEYVSGTEPWEAGTVVNVIYAPGKRASDISGTGDERTLAFDLSSQAGTIDALGDYALMTGKGTIAGTDLALTFAHALAIVSLDTLKNLTASESGYSVSIKGDSLSNCGTFGFGADGALTFTRGADGAIGTSGTFTANENGELSPVFFALPQANFGDLTVSVAKGADTVKYNLEVNREMMAGNYYYKASLASEFAITPGGEETSTGVYAVDGGTYTIQSGTPLADVKKARVGDVITVTPTPDTGFAVDTITVNKTDTDVSVAFDTTANTFIMPASPVTITVLFKSTITGDINGYDYVKIAGKKWATMNLGANNPQDFGDYYTWGNVSHDSRDISTDVFGYDSYPTPGKDIDDADDWRKETNDAAYSNWGDSWRLPTKEDFVSLATDCAWHFTLSYKGTGVMGFIVYIAQKDEEKGLAFYNGQTYKWDESQEQFVSHHSWDLLSYYSEYNYPHIFFPCASYGTSSSPFTSPFVYGAYWASTFSSLDTDVTNHKVYALWFSLSGPIRPVTTLERHYACSIRPVSD